MELLGNIGKYKRQGAILVPVHYDSQVNKIFANIFSLPYLLLIVAAYPIGYTTIDFSFQFIY